MNKKVYSGNILRKTFILHLLAGALSIQQVGAQAATKVLGQPDLVTGTAGSTSSATNHDFYFPYGIATDGSGNLYVAEYRNRVLIFKSAETKANGSAADYVLGQNNFTSISQGTTASKMYIPTSVLADSSGNLYVSDFNNNRVLIFRNIEGRVNANTLTNGAAADYVIGQTTFAGSAFGTTASTLHAPNGMAMDGAGNLFLVDGYNHRVLMYAGVRAAVTNATFVSNPSATKVLGQPDLNTGGTTPPPISDHTFSYPQGLLIDGTSLYVADMSHHRVLRFDQVAGKSNNAPADAVFGQPDFISGNSGSSASMLNAPYDVAMSAANELLIAEGSNDRISRFAIPAAATSGASSTGTIGADDYSGPSATNNGHLLDIARASGSNIWVLDQSYHRILLFNTSASPLPLGLISFTAKGTEKSVLLTWALSSNHPFSAATVQRSLDGDHFSSIATIPTDTRTSYGHTDIAPLPGQAYYRLQLLHHDGKLTYSAVCTINGTSIRTLPEAWPNPVSSTLSVRTGSNAPCSVWLTDATGKIVIAPQQITTTGSLHTELLPIGTYFLHFANWACLRITK